MLLLEYRRNRRTPGHRYRGRSIAIALKVPERGRQPPDTTQQRRGEIGLVEDEHLNHVDAPQTVCSRTALYGTAT